MRDLTLSARDGFPLAATLFEPESTTDRIAIVSSATGTPRRYYRHFARALAEAGWTAVTYDYRGIGGSRPDSLRAFEATVLDWALLDMAAIVDWADKTFDRIVMVGHSIGGQVAGMLDNASRIDRMLTISSQSGYWRLQGAEQKAVTFFHTYLTLPVLSRIYGYMPFAKFGGEDLPKQAALQWASWCRNPQYLLGDSSLPLARYRDFMAPVLAFSIEDDKWGTARSVDAMMSAYPHVERRHLVPNKRNVGPLGHFGYFRSGAAPLWEEAITWLGESSR